MDMRNKILIISRELFISSGFSSITMDDIAKEVAMSKKTLYKYFPNKEALLKEAILSHFSVIESRIKMVVEDEKIDIIGKFKKVTEIIIYYISNISPAFIRDVKKNTPELWNNISKERKKLIIRYFTVIIDEGVKSGQMRKDLDKELVFNIYLTAVENIINPGSLSELSCSPGQVFEVLLKLFFEGMLTDKGRNNLNELKFGGAK